MPTIDTTKEYPTSTDRLNSKRPVQARVNKRQQKPWLKKSLEPTQKTKTGSHIEHAQDVFHTGVKNPKPKEVPVDRKADRKTMQTVETQQTIETVDPKPKRKLNSKDTSLTPKKRKFLLIFVITLMLFFIIFLGLRLKRQKFLLLNRRRRKQSKA
jgi:hypothetical protein